MKYSDWLYQLADEIEFQSCIMRDRTFYLCTVLSCIELGLIYSSGWGNTVRFSSQLNQAGYIAKLLKTIKVKMHNFDRSTGRSSITIQGALLKQGFAGGTSGRIQWLRSMAISYECGVISMNTCKTCKHWCENMYTTDDFKECCITEWVEPNELPTSVTAMCLYADASDDQGLYAGILTGKDFGCVQHKEKK